jgi:hypothetical protein
VVTRLTEVSAVLADVATLGPAFALATDPAEAGRGHLVPLGRLLADRGALRDQLTAVAAALHSDEDRVAASWLYGGMAARLVAPLLATAAVHRATCAGVARTTPAGPAGGSPRPASCRGATRTRCAVSSSPRSGPSHRRCARP